MYGAIRSSPDKILLSSLWDNPLITRANKPIPSTNYDIFKQKVKYIADFFIPGTNTLRSITDFENDFGLKVNADDYTEIKYILLSAITNLELSFERLPSICLPFQPLLVNIATQSSKGCNIYYRLLRKGKNSRKTLESRESKWHQELGRICSVPFWNKTYQYWAGIKNDNRIKWMQYQIVRNFQFTNYRVHKFKPHVSPLCSYCNEAEERISHLYYRCQVVLNFWKAVKLYLSDLGYSISLSEHSILFGDKKETPHSMLNIIILWVKHYIWTTKFKNTHPSLNNFKIVFRKRLQDLKELCDTYEEFKHNFSRWNVIYNSLALENRAN